MFNTFHRYLFLALIPTLCGAWGWGGPDLSCSSDAATTTVSHIIADAVIAHHVEQAKDFTVTSELSIIRTLATTDKQHTCAAVLSSQVVYSGPVVTNPPKLIYPSTAGLTTAQLQAVLDAIMTAANISPHMQQYIHLTQEYSQPEMNLGVENLVQNAMLQLSSINVVVPEADRQYDWNAAFIAIKSTTLFRTATDSDIKAMHQFAVAAEAVDQQSHLLAYFSQKAKSFNGEISYTVEATDAGQAYITVRLPNAS